MLVRRFGYLSLLGAAATASGLVACGHAGGGATGGETPAEPPLPQASELVVKTTPLQAPATPFAQQGAVLRSDNVVRSIAVAGNVVTGLWGTRRGPDTATARLLVGGAPVTLPGTWGIEGAAATRSAGGVRESVAPTAVGYQRTWTVDAVPPGGGVSVSLAAAADGVLSLDSAGLHTVRDGGGFLIGTATWVDAAGARTTIQPTYRGGLLTYDVPASVVAHSALPAVLDPDVGPEFLVPPSQTVTPWYFANDPTLGGATVFPLVDGGVGVIVTSSNPYWGSGDLLDLYVPSATSPTGLTLQTSVPFSGPPGQGTNGYCGGPCPPPPTPVSANCGNSDQCVAWAYVASTGTVYMQRFDTTTWKWFDASPVSVTNSFSDSPATNSNPQLVYNGGQFLVCWLDTGASNVHCTTRSGVDLSAVGSTASIDGPAAVTAYTAAATAGAFGVLIPGLTVDASVGTPAAVTVISSTGTAASPLSLPSALGVNPLIVGESGGDFLVASSGAASFALPALYGTFDAGVLDASVQGSSGSLVQRVSAAGALSGTTFSPTGSFAASVLEQYCGTNMAEGASLPAADAGLLPVPSRGTLGWSGNAAFPLAFSGGGGGLGGGSPYASFCEQFASGTYSFGTTQYELPPFLLAASGPLAGNGFVRADPTDGGLCSTLDAGALGSAALQGVCYDLAGGGLGAFVAPPFVEAGTGGFANIVYSSHSVYELTPGATTGTPHPEIAGSVPSALAGIQNGFVTPFEVLSAPNGCNGCTPTAKTAGISSTLYDAGTGRYAPAGSAIPFYAYGDRRTALHGSYDSTSQSYFVGWFDEGNTPLVDAGGNGPLPNSAIYVNVYADPGGATDSGTTPKGAPVAITPPASFTFAQAPVNGCITCSSSNGSLDTEPLWSMDAALDTALVSYLALKSNGTTVLAGQLLNSNGTLKGSAGPLSSVTGVTALRTCHSLTDYFVSYLTSTGWSTVQVDTSLNVTAEAAGAPVPFANAVGSVMPAYLTVPSGTSTTTHVGIVNVNSPTTVVADFDSEYGSWNPSTGCSVGSGGGNGGGYFGALDVYSGTDYVIVTYPVYNCSNGGSATTYCARINATTGAFVDTNPCSPPSNPSCNGGIGNYCGWGGAGAPGVGDAAEKLLSINVNANPPTVQRWFVEPWAEGETPDLPFPSPVRPFASNFVWNDSGSPLFSWDTSAQVTVVGGNVNALALYFGIWTQPDGMVERDLYARWVKPGLVGSETCAVNDDCDTNNCVSGVCQPAIPPEAGTSSSSSGGSSSGSGSDGGKGGGSSGSIGGGGDASATGSSSGGGSGGGSSGTGSSGTGGSDGSATGSSSGGSSSGTSGTSSGTGGSSGGSEAGTSSGSTSSSGSSSGTATSDSGPGEDAGEDAGGTLPFDGGPTVVPGMGSSSSKSGCGCRAVGTEGQGSRGDVGVLLTAAMATVLVRRRRR